MRCSLPQNHPIDGCASPSSLPMPWDRMYLDRWFAFVRQVAERYGDSPAFRVIGAAGPTSVSDEMTLPGSPAAIRQWLSHGYTPAKYLGAWEETFHVFASAFPNQCVSLSAPNLPILENGRFNHAERMRAKQDIVERAMRVFGRRLTIQSNDLHTGHARVHPTSAAHAYRRAHAWHLRPPLNRSASLAHAPATAVQAIACRRPAYRCTFCRRCACPCW
jgi:hypothetical protein